ncbi:DUF6314 family protein [Streptomyces sp. WMMC905]|uniref:DUF6314 family protein n=1 Tax=Streptomyces sp. WMMC905 TaxID=3404123 RepID=UPI003B940677
MPEIGPIPDTLEYLTGRWRAERHVRDVAADITGRFEGTALLSPPADASAGLVYRETGRFAWRGTTRRAERTLWFRPAADPGAAEVFFADGRPFHDLDLRGGLHRAEHPCAADHYRGEFTVLDADRWRAVWRVRGPAKDLSLTTEYTRDR